jgi:hypothetical protein
METIIKINSLADIRAIAQEGFANQPAAVVGLNYFIEVAGTVIHVTVDRTLDVRPVKL